MAGGLEFKVPSTANHAMIIFILLAILTEGFVVFSCFVCSDKGLNFYNIIYLGCKKK